MKSWVALSMFALVGCSNKPATEEQLRAALSTCGIEQFEIRLDWENRPAWYWSSIDGVDNDEIDCVRRHLGRQGAEANFVDRDVAEASTDRNIAR